MGKQVVVFVLLSLECSKGLLAAETTGGQLSRLFAEVSPHAPRTCPNRLPAEGLTDRERGCLKGAGNLSQGER